MNRPFKKVQVWIIAGQKVLLLKTQAQRGGFWQPVTGSVEAGETLRVAALRELREETGIRVSQARVRPLNFKFEFVDRRWKRGRVIETVFYVKKNKICRVKLDSTEHVEYRWCSVNRAIRMLHHDSNRKALQLLTVPKG